MSEHRAGEEPLHYQLGSTWTATSTEMCLYSAETEMPAARLCPDHRNQLPLFTWHLSGAFSPSLPAAPEMWHHRYGVLTVKLYAAWRGAPRTTTLFKGQLYSHPHSLWLLMCIEHLFPFFNFQPLCIPKSKANLMYPAYSSILVLYPFSYFISLDCKFNLFIFKVIFLRYRLTIATLLFYVLQVFFSSFIGK